MAVRWDNGIKKRHISSVETGGTEESLLFSLLWEAWLDAKISPTRTVQQDADVPGTQHAASWPSIPLGCFAQPVVVVTCSSRHGSKCPAPTERIQRQRRPQMIWKVSGAKLPSVLISRSLPFGALQNLTVVEVKCAAGCLLLSFFLMSALREIDYLTWILSPICLSCLGNLFTGTNSELPPASVGE